MKYQIKKNEFKSLSAITLLSLTVGLLFAYIFKKHAVSAIYSIGDMCKKMLEGYTLNLSNPISLFIILIASASIINIVVKLVFSIKKTRKKQRSLEEHVMAECQNKALELQKLYGIEKTIRMVESKKHIALVVGIFSPKIYISTGLMKDLREKELETVLLHEYYHSLKWHTLKYLLLETLKSAMFFIPIFKDLVQGIKYLMETEADNYAVVNQGSSAFLEEVLKKVKTTNYNLIPGFSAFRNNNKQRVLTFKTANILITGLSLCIGIYLLNKPSTTHQKYVYISESCKQQELEIQASETSNSSMPMSRNDFLSKNNL